MGCRNSICQLENDQKEIESPIDSINILNKKYIETVQLEKDSIIIMVVCIQHKEINQWEQRFTHDSLAQISKVFRINDEILEDYQLLINVQPKFQFSLRDYQDEKTTLCITFDTCCNQIMHTVQLDLTQKPIQQSLLINMIALHNLHLKKELEDQKQEIDKLNQFLSTADTANFNSQNYAQNENNKITLKYDSDNNTYTLQGDGSKKQKEKLQKQKLKEKEEENSAESLKAVFDQVKEGAKQQEKQRNEIEDSDEEQNQRDVEIDLIVKKQELKNSAQKKFGLFHNIYNKKDNKKCENDKNKHKKAEIFSNSQQQQIISFQNLLNKNNTNNPLENEAKEKQEKKKKFQFLNQQKHKDIILSEHNLLAKNSGQGDRGWVYLTPQLRKDKATKITFQIERLDREGQISIGVVDMDFQKEDSILISDFDNIGQYYIICRRDLSGFSREEKIEPLDFNFSEGQCIEMTADPIKKQICFLISQRNEGKAKKQCVIQQWNVLEKPVAAVYLYGLNQAVRILSK